LLTTSTGKIMSNKTLDVTLKILDYFKENPDAKVRPLSLSNYINEDPTLVDAALAKCPMFFLYLPTEQSFKLNKSGQYKGDVVTMKIHAEDIVKEKNIFQKHWYLIVLSVLVITIYLLLDKI